MTAITANNITPSTAVLFTSDFNRSFRSLVRNEIPFADFFEILAIEMDMAGWDTPVSVPFAKGLVLNFVDPANADAFARAFAQAFNSLVG